MVKTNRSTLHMLYNIQQSATQDSDYIHVAIVPTLPCRTATTTRLSCRTVAPPPSSSSGCRQWHAGNAHCQPFLLMSPWSAHRGCHLSRPAILTPARWVESLPGSDVAGSRWTTLQHQQYSGRVVLSPMMQCRLEHSSILGCHLHKDVDASCGWWLYC